MHNLKCLTYIRKDNESPLACDLTTPRSNYHTRSSLRFTGMQAYALVFNRGNLNLVNGDQRPSWVAFTSEHPV